MTRVGAGRLAGGLIGLDLAASAGQVLAAISGRILGGAVLTGTYRRH